MCTRQEAEFATNLPTPHRLQHHNLDRLQTTQPVPTEVRIATSRPLKPPMRLNFHKLLKHPKHLKRTMTDPEATKSVWDHKIPTATELRTATCKPLNHDFDRYDN